MLRVLRILFSGIWSDSPFQIAGFKDTSDVIPLYLGDDKTDEDAFKVGHKS